MALITPTQLADRMKSDIIRDVIDGRIPTTVRTFSDLHVYVDANLYGGTEALLEAHGASKPDTDKGHAEAISELVDLCNVAQGIVGKWIGSPEWFRSIEAGR